MIELKGLRKSYGKLEALHGIDMSVKPGGFVAIMGESGSGKSTLMNILGCLDSHTSGEYFLAGTNVAALKKSELTRLRSEYIGFVFQSFYLLPRLTALENVELPLVYAGVAPDKRRERAKELIARVGLEERSNHMPWQLSGGQCQRVAIARALANNPKLLLADEPTGNLDARTGREIMHLMNELNSMGSTIVLITHEREIASYATDVAYLKNGKLYGGCTCATS